MPKILKTALALLSAAFLLSGCPAADSKNLSEQPPSNILRFDVAYSFGPFVADPHIQAGSSHLMPFVFSYLAVPDQAWNFQPDLAEKWIYDKKTFEWVFYLRKDARFHDGKPVTARDAAFSLKTVLASLLPELYAEIQSLDAVSDATLRIRLSKNDPKLLEKIWDIEIFQTPSDPNRPPEEFLIGSGPFSLKERRADRIVLEANAAYYRGRPSLDGMIFTSVPDQESIWTRLMGGQSDVATEITPENVPITEACADLFYLNCHSLNFYVMMLFNTHDPLFSDVRVRKALTLAINREHIVQKILGGNGSVAAGPMGLDPRYHNPEVAPVPYDPRKALELLSQAGWKLDGEDRFLVKNGKYFEFTVYAAEEFPTHQRLAQYLRLCFNDIGIRLYVRQMSWKALVKSYFRNTDYQAVIAEARDPSRTFEHLKRLWCKTDAACSKSGGLEDARLTALFESLEAESDPEAQRKLFYAIEARILELQPAAFLYDEIVCDVMSRRFNLPGPFYLYPNRGWNLQFASLKTSAPDNWRQNTGF